MMRRAVWLAMAFFGFPLAGCQAPPPSFSMLGPYNATQVAPPGTGSYGRTAPGVAQQPGAGAYYTRPSAAVIAPTSSSLASASPAGDWRAATSASLVGNSNLPGAAADSASASAASSAVGQVMPASAISPIGSLSSTGAVDASGKETVRIVEPTGSNSTTAANSISAITGGGMPVNDATRSRPPRLFSPPPGVIAISQWPAAATSSAPTGIAVDAQNPARDMRGLSGAYPVAQVSAQEPIPATASSGVAAAAGSAAGPTASSTDSSASATASAAPLGWKVKDGLK